MADADRQHWNARYADRFAERAYDFTPDDWLVGLAPTLSPRRPGALALDLAAGPGRHALYLAELGYRVSAWDIAEVGLQVMRDELMRRAVAGRPLPVEPVQVDLDHANLPVAHFDLILDAHFLDRGLFGPMTRALRPGGLLVIRTFLYVAGGAVTSRLSNPAHALQPGELERTFG